MYLDIIKRSILSFSPNGTTRAMGGGNMVGKILIPWYYKDRS